MILFGDMNNLYWLSVVGKINSLGTVCLFMGIGIILGTVILLTILLFQWREITPDEDEIKSVSKSKKKLFRIGLPILITGILIKTFVPTANELYAIYGVGTIIDYCKNNEKVKELPDSVVKALNKYLESLTND